jgi:ABC-type thiamin/hydroxymethylpyrimidine transport system permease subunit
LTGCFIPEIGRAELSEKVGAKASALKANNFNLGSVKIGLV